MLCQECNQRDATVHFTKIVNQDKQDFHLCESCAREKGDLMMKGFGNMGTMGSMNPFDTPAGGFSFHNLLSGLLGLEGTGSLEAQASPHVQPGNRCATCGLTYAEFAQVGRFGCADCYRHFHQRLEPLLRRIHGGATTHTGKVPSRTGGLIKKRKQISAMRQELQQKIAAEQFEEAAVLRDQIRTLEAQLGASEGV